MLTIRVFELGYTGDVDLVRVCRIINRGQKVFRASVGPRVESIGEPDISLYGYSRTRLFALFPEPIGSELLVGVTHVPIEGNLFSMTQIPGCVVLSLHETREIRDRAGRTAEEYVAQSTISELLQIQYMLTPSAPSWIDLVHDEVRCCLFDFVPLKMDKVNKLRSGHIDTQCRDKLLTAGVDADVVAAAEQVLYGIQTPTLGRTFSDGLQRPVFSLVIGGLAGGMLINLASSAIAGAMSVRIAYAAGIVATLIVLVVGVNWFAVRRVARKRR